MVLASRLAPCSWASLSPIKIILLLLFGLKNLYTTNLKQLLEPCFLQQKA